MTPYRAVLGACLLALTILSPVLGARAASSPPTPVRTRTSTPSAGPTLRLAMPDTAATVDPAMVADEENVELASLLYSGLVRLDASYRVVPDAASRYTVSPDHRIYTFFLRSNLRFSNGDPVRAQDFRFAITRSLSQSLKSPSAPTYLLDIVGAHDVLTGKARTVSGIKVINDRTLQITTRWPVPYFPMELTYPTSFALDSKRILKQGAADNTLWYATPIGSGPFRLKSWIPNQRIVLTRNSHYYGPKPGVAKVTISLTPLPPSDGAQYTYVSHNLDVATLGSSASTVAQKPGVRETSMLSIAGIYMNCNSGPFKNAGVRRAFTLALPRKKLVAGALGSTVTPFQGAVPPGQWGYDSSLHPESVNPVQSRKDLAEAGYPDPKKFPAVTLYYSVDQQTPAMAKGIARLIKGIVSAWKSTLHVSVDTKQLTLLTLYAQAQSNSLPLYLSGWSADYPDPHDWLSAQWRTKALNNNVEYSDKKFDELVSAADVTWDGARRLSLYDQAQEVLVDDAAWIPLYVPHRLVYVRPGVTNVNLTGYGIIPKNGTWASVQSPAKRSTSAHKRG